MPPVKGGGLHFTAGMNSPVAVAARSQQQTASLLYDKLQASQEKNKLAEQRAEEAVRSAQEVSAKANTEQQRMQAELHQVKYRLREVSDELEHKSGPTRETLNRVHALEAKAYIMKQRLAGLEEGSEEHAHCKEEHEHHDAVARRARHCAMTGGSERVHHMHLNPEQAQEQAMGEALDDRLASIMHKRGLTKPVPEGVSAEAAYSSRIDSYMDAVSEDLRAGLQLAQEQYAAAKEGGPEARPV